MTHNEEHIIIMLKEYKNKRDEFPGKLTAEIAEEMSKVFAVIIKKDNNGECLNGKNEPCLCHLTAMNV